MARGDMRMALAAIKTSKWHSLLTMLGIVIGVVSVVTTVSLGEGVKQRIVGQINQAGPDLITVRPGRTVSRNEQGQITNVSVLSNFTFGSLTEKDLASITAAKGVRTAVPLAYITGVAKANDRDYISGPIIATTEPAAALMKQTLLYGDFFSQGDGDKNVSVLGKRVAEELFRENNPIGRSFTVRDQTFVVQGIFDEFSSSPLALNTDYNYAIFIPYASSKRLNDSQPQIYQVLVSPDSPQNVLSTAKAITDNLTADHGGQADFTVLTQAENLATANSVLTILTSFIASIAGISLLVGGIGIMNILLLSVTERTREIGIRKAIGATNRQILGQFLVEAVILSLTGGLVGVLLSMLANYFLRVFTNLTPVITLPIVLIAVSVAVAVGIVFGIMPAARAARKDPIEALRHE